MPAAQRKARRMKVSVGVFSGVGLKQAAVVQRTTAVKGVVAAGSGCYNPRPAGWCWFGIRALEAVCRWFPTITRCWAFRLMPTPMWCAALTVRRPCSCIRTGTAAVRRPANGCCWSTRRGRRCAMPAAGPNTTAGGGRPMAKSRVDASAGKGTPWVWMVPTVYVSPNWTGS